MGRDHLRVGCGPDRRLLVDLRLHVVPAGPAKNDLRWCNKTAQRAMDALVEHYEPSDRIADLKVFMREFINDAPSIVSSVRVDLFAYNKDLKNYQPNTITPFDNMMDVDI